MGLTDLALILLLELRIVYFTPSFAQVFRARDNIKMAIDVMRAFFILNGMSKESGNYHDLISRLEKTKDVNFDLK